MIGFILNLARAYYIDMSEKCIENLLGFRELYVQAYEFMKAVSEEDIDRAERIPKRNLGGLDCYRLIVSLLKEKRETESKYRNVVRLYELLKQANREQQQKQSEVLLREWEQQTQVRTQLGRWLQEGDVGQVRQLAQKYHLFAVDELMQQVLQYRWVLAWLQSAKESALRERSLEFEFRKGRQFVKDALVRTDFNKSLVNDVVEGNLRQILDDLMEPLEFQSLSSSVATKFQKMKDEFTSRRLVLVECFERQIKVRKQLEMYKQTARLGGGVEAGSQSLFGLIEEFIGEMTKAIERSVIIKEMLERKKSKLQKEEKSELTLTKNTSVGSPKKRIFGRQEKQDWQMEMKSVVYKLRNTFNLQSEESDMKGLMVNVLKAFDRYDDEAVKSEAYRKTAAIFGDDMVEITEILKSLCAEMKQRGLPIALEEESDHLTEVCKIVVKYFRKVANAYELMLRKSQRALGKGQNVQTKGQKTQCSQKQCGVNTEIVQLQGGVNDQHVLECRDEVYEGSETGSSLSEDYLKYLRERSREDLLRLVISQARDLEAEGMVNVQARENVSLMMGKIQNLQSEVLRGSRISRAFEQGVSVDEGNSQLGEVQEVAVLRELLQQRQREIATLKSSNAHRLRELTAKLQVEIQKYKGKYEETLGYLNSTLDNLKEAHTLNEETIRLRSSMRIDSKEYINLEEHERRVSQAQAERQKFKELSEALAREKEEERVSKERLAEQLREEIEKNNEIESRLEEQKVECESIGVGSSQALPNQLFVDPQITQKKGAIEATNVTFSISEMKVQQSKFLQFAPDQIAGNQIDLLKIKNYESKIQEMQAIIAENQKIKQNMQLMIKTQKEQYTLKIQELEISLKEANKKMQQNIARTVLNAPENLQNAHLFTLGSIFDERATEERLFLINSLTAYVGPIKRSRLLYRFDAFNRTNPHRYIDKQPNLVLIAKTIFGKYVAGFSKEAIDSAGNKVGFGLLLPLWNRRVFEIAANKKPVIYDDYFIIFGNSELRLKAQETKLFSNFGISNAYFNSEGCKVDALLGEGTEREINVEAYEVYALDLYRSF